jgi:hypothetical protein
MRIETENGKRDRKKVILIAGPGTNEPRADESRKGEDRFFFFCFAEGGRKVTVQVFCVFMVLA